MAWGFESPLSHPELNAPLKRHAAVSQGPTDVAFVIFAPTETAHHSCTGRG